MASNDDVDMNTIPLLNCPAMLHTGRYDHPSLRLDDFQKDLDLVELERLDRCRSNHARRQFCIVRSKLRHLLAGYLDIVPEKIRFQYGNLGKPYIDSDQNHTGICFSVAHSGGWFAIAVSHGKKVGVDIELNRPGLKIHRIAEHYFAEAEKVHLEKSNDPSGDFFKIWTAKEAFLKARGSGFAFALNKFAVGFDTNGIPRLDRLDDVTDSVANWALDIPGVDSRITIAVAVKTRE